MAFANPTIDPPRLHSPAKRSLHSRSPSRSPVRQHHARDSDPLLRDLSPSTTLRAFRNEDLARRQLGSSVDRASPAQRALGAKAAQACIDLRSWVREVEAWEWPGTFDVPEPVRKKQRMSSMSVGSLASRPSMSRSQTQEEEDAEQEHWGSLPSDMVQSYERRLDEIGRDLDAMDVEELKDFVLSAHSQASFGGADIDDSIGAIGADTNLRHLDDFTALITATILSALPFLSRLTRLLHAWHTRLDILRKTPSYLFHLRQARTDLDHGWAALAISSHPAAADAMKRSNASFTRDTMMEMKAVVSKQVHSLGRRLDGFLDELEGRQEVVPERWIEEFEVLEQQYGNWVVVAERKVIEGEWATTKDDVKDNDGTVLGNRGIEERPNTATEVTVGPTITTATTAGNARDTRMNTSTHTTTSGPTSTTVTTVIPHSSPKKESRGRDVSPVRDRPRHVPIVVGAYISKPDQPTPIAELPTNIRSVSPLPRSNTPKSMDSATSQDVKKRAAFLNGEIENDGLMRSKPAAIVRPFEHASNAFTRLFKQKEGSKEAEDTPFGPTVKRKKSKDAGLDAGTALKGKRSSSSLKGMLSRDKKSEKRASGSTRGSRLSGTSSAGSKKRASSAGRSSADRMEYGDMVRPPATPHSEESRSKRSPFRSKSFSSRSKKNADMEYGDMVRMPELDRQQIENRSRTSTLSKESQAKSAPRSTNALGYGDLIAMPDDSTTLKSKEKRSKEKRPPTPKKNDVKGSKAKDMLEYGDMARVPARGANTFQIGGDGAAKSQPDYLAPDAVATKRTSRQNITALPELQMPKDPESYHPSGLNSPFHSPIEPESQVLDVPEDWPLSNVPTPRGTPSPVKEDGPDLRAVISKSNHDNRTSADEIEMRREPNFAADTFDREFVHTIPAQSLRRPVSRDHGPEDREVVFQDATHAPRRSGEVIPQVDSDSEEDGVILWTSKSNSDRSWMRTGVASTSRILEWQEPQPPARTSSRRNEGGLQKSLPRPVSMVEEAEEEGLSTPNDSDGESGKKHRSDNAAGYFGSSSPAKSSPRTKISSSKGLEWSNSTPPVSPAVLKLRMPSEAPPDASTGEDSRDRSDELFRRASTASIESHSRSELKNIEIVRRSSVGSNRDSAPATPLEANRSSVEGAGFATVKTPTSPLPYKGFITFPSPPSVPVRASSLRASPEISPRGNDQGEINVPKRKHGSGRREMLTSPRKDLRPGEDNFDRHVSEVLDRVHAPIRFRTRPGAETPNALSKPARLPKAGERKNMTLAPAENSSKKASSADPDVKLYHLTQAGRAEPIRLFVRLVGEGDRVMVRVGGGWADLADYLRQYAEHHGSRTVSEGTLELQTASASASGSASATKRTFSGPPSAVTEPKSLAREKSPITPLSAFPALERPRTKDSEKSWLSREQPEFPMGDSGDEDGDMSPTVPHTRDIAPPRRSSWLSSSRPSTAQSARLNDATLDATSSSPSSSTPLGGPGGGLSLAGPSKLKADLPEQKARWVEGMIQQVNKSASAEKSREEKEKYVAEMGKVGSVRRVAFRSASGTG